MDYFTDEFRRYRKLAKLTQTEAAAVFGTSQPVWSEWEAGLKIPNGHAIELLFKKLAKFDAEGCEKGEET